MKQLLLIGWLVVATVTTAQDSSVAIPKWELNGYVKSMQWVSTSSGLNQLLTNNLLHNRINTKWKPGGGFVVAAEFRNRIIWGDEVRLLPKYAEQLRNTNEYQNLSVTWLQSTSLVAHTNTERLWVSWDQQRWNIKVGRQRINWGITTVWNPNDVFNTYNFLDFDYEERPGSDAVKLNYQVSDFSDVEVAYAAGNRFTPPVTAIKYGFNKRGYDFQLLAGVFEQRLTLGAGWAGSIEDAGFKGEVQYFAPTPVAPLHLNLSIEADYAFEKGWYANAGILYNSEGLQTAVAGLDSLNFRFSPRNLMPTRWNLATTVSKEFTPLLTGSATVLFAPGTNLLLVLPSLRYNLSTNLDADLIWQSFFAATQRFEALNHRAFLRLKFSF